MARTVRSTRGSLGNPKGSLSRQAERMLRAADKTERAAATMAVAARLNQDEVGRFLVSALAAELNPDLEISVPACPVTARQIIWGMDGFVAVPDPVWSGRNIQYQVPHPGIVFKGVVNAKNEAVKAADQIVQSGWYGNLGDDFERARAKVRAGQILIDYLHCMEGKAPSEFPLGSVWVAEDLVTDHCFALAADHGVTLKGFRVRQSTQFTYGELAENLGRVIAVSAFGGELEYRYSLAFCSPQYVTNIVRSMMMVVDGRASELNEETQKRLARFATMYNTLPADEQRLVRYAAEDVLKDLQAMVDMEKVEAVLAAGNGHAAASDAVAVEGVETAAA